MKWFKTFGTIGLSAFVLAFTAFYSSSHPSAKPASLVTMSGDIEEFLNDLPLPGCNTNAFVQPSNSDIATWREAMDALLDEQYQTAATLADPLGYDLIEFTDPGRDKIYYLFREQDNARGLGTYVYNPGACRLLSLEAPHAGGDTNTKPESIAMYLELNAVTLLIAGTHRCSNSQASPCSGTTTICNSCYGLSGNQPYRISDVAHYMQNFFQPAHEEIATQVPGIVSVSVHGFGGRAGGFAADVEISNGTTGDRSQSLATQLANEYNQIFAQLGMSLIAGSCNAAGGPNDQCGGTNVQGRFVNGSANPCTTSVSTVSGTERFIHVEQVMALRQPPAPGQPGWQMTIDAFAAVFPCSPIGHLMQEESGATSEAGDEFGKSLATGDFNGDGKETWPLERLLKTSLAPVMREPSTHTRARRQGSFLSAVGFLYNSRR